MYFSVIIRIILINSCQCDFNCTVAENKAERFIFSTQRWCPFLYRQIQDLESQLYEHTLKITHPTTWTLQQYQPYHQILTQCW